MAGTNSSEEIKVDKPHFTYTVRQHEKVGFLEGMLIFIIASLFSASALMVTLDDVWDRFDATNPGFFWYASVTVAIAVIAGLVKTIWDITGD